MAKIKIEQRCNGPFEWETVGPERRLVAQGLCGSGVSVEYDDSIPFSSKIGSLIDKVGLKCEKCSSQGKRMLNKAEMLAQKRIDEVKKGKAYSSDSGKEHLF